MALTVSVPANRYDVWGHIKAVIATVTFDADLDEAGESFAAADVGLSEIYAVIPAGEAQSSGGAEVTAPVHWNANTLFLKVSDSDFYGDNFDASTYSVKLLVLGI